MRPSVFPQLRSFSLFSSMRDENFESLMQSAYLQVFPAQLELITEGDPADFLHVVIEGCVELYAHSNNRESSLALLHPVSTFILAAVIKDASYLMSARTYTKSRVLLIPSECVREAIEKDVAFSHRMIVELANCYHGVIRVHKEMKLRTAVERLANKLLRFNEEQGGTGRIELQIEKRSLASLLGMTPENLSRAFNTLKPYGVVVNGTNVELNDLSSLKILAKPNKLIDKVET